MRSIRNRKGTETIIYSDTIEDEALDQIRRLSEYEAYDENKIRIMPDVHAGKGCAIGTTMTIRDKVTPNLVGVDIGCGMLTIGLDEEQYDFPKLDKLIKTRIPSGFNVHEKARETFDFTGLRCKAHVDLERAVLSIGSLGGGNHFIELGKSEHTGRYYLVIHSGSRKLGSDVCEYYQGKAIKSMAMKDTGKTDLIASLKAEGRHKEIKRVLRARKQPSVNRDLAYLSGQDFEDYLNDMALIQRFASLNRATMARIILKEMGLGEGHRFETIHNYIDFNRMILRKGAVSAEKQETLLIPINMRDGSLICRGKGNENWNFSAPHGAGRLMSRSMAKKVLAPEEYRRAMTGIYTTTADNRTLDEAPQAYKPMQEIISNITDTVEIVDRIRPVYNFKAQ